MERKLHFRYDIDGKGDVYSVFSGNERIFTFEEALKKGVVKEVSRKEEAYKFRPGYLEVKYRIVPSPYGTPDLRELSTRTRTEELPPLELDRILEEKEKLREKFRDTAEKGRKVELELRKLMRELYYCVRPKIGELKTELEEFDTIHPSELGDDREAIRERLEQELQELEERERELEERIEMMRKEFRKELAVLQLYRSVLDTGEEEFWKDPFVLPEYLLELLEVPKAGDDEVMGKVEELVGWTPETPQGLAFALALVGKIYEMRPESLDMDRFKGRHFRSAEIAADFILRELESFQENLMSRNNDLGIEW